MCRVGQNHIYTVYIRYFWQGKHQIYGHIWCIYTVLANPTHVCSMRKTAGICPCTYTHTHTHTHAHTHTNTHIYLVCCHVHSQVRSVLRMRDYALVLGMPGTGKTSTIVQAIAALQKVGRTVLLTAYTHRCLHMGGVCVCVCVCARARVQLCAFIRTTPSCRPLLHC